MKCTFNFTVIPEIHISGVNIDEFDALAIPGGIEEAGFYKDAYSEDFLDIIREFDRAGKIIASISIGALTIGESDLKQKPKGCGNFLLKDHTPCMTMLYAAPLAYPSLKVFNLEVLTYLPLRSLVLLKSLSFSHEYIQQLQNPLTVLLGAHHI